MNKAQLLTQSEKNADYSALSNLKNLTHVLDTGSSAIKTLSKPISKAYHKAKSSEKADQERTERDAERKAREAKQDEQVQKNLDEDIRYHNAMIDIAERRNK